MKFIVSIIDRQEPDVTKQATQEQVTSDNTIQAAVRATTRYAQLHDTDPDLAEQMASPHTDATAPGRFDIHVAEFNEVSEEPVEIVWPVDQPTGGAPTE